MVGDNNEDLTEQIDTLDMLVEKTKEDDSQIGNWCLEMVRGPMIGERIFLKDGTTTFGRSPECNVFLDDITVSRNHCEFTLENGHVKVVDLGSTNGTYVSSNAVDKSDLEAGDTIQIGRYVFLLTRRSA
ncbi:MAG: FHA domain-containing protein [Acidimicrobiia bacterium]